VALRKELRVGDSLKFTLEVVECSCVDIRLSEIVGRKAILVITANKEQVPITHIKCIKGQQ
jgi:hypothetical protein